MQAERSLRESEMRAGNVMESALDDVVMMDREGAFPDPWRTQPGLTELFVNGVEHGNLNLSYAEKSALPDYAQKRVRVSLDRTETALRMSIADDGKGFDWSQFLDLDVTRSADGHGRGIALAKAISFDKLDFRGFGNQVMVSVSLKGIDAGSWLEEKRKFA